MRTQFNVSKLNNSKRAKHWIGISFKQSLIRISRRATT